MDTEDDTKTKEKKLYKGSVVVVSELAKTLKDPTPVQPVKREYKIHGYEYSLPPSFVLTRFSPGSYRGFRTINYYSPKTKNSGVMNIPEDMELNVLSGERGKELSEEYSTMLQTNLRSVVRRMATTSGADPEIFVEDKKGVIPAWTFLPAKEKGDIYVSDGASGAVYWDGFQAEFTTPPGQSCLVRVSDAIRTALERIKARAPGGAELSLKSVVPVDPEVMSAAEDQHVAFGCAPSFNVYGLKGNTQDGRSVPFRFAGGHVHIGLNDLQKPKIVEFVKALDKVVGVGCVSLFGNFDSPIRRQYYGQAGEYRTPAHGLEYRVLSNAWLAHPAIFNLVFELTRGVLGVVDGGIELSQVWKTSEDATIDAIMSSNPDKARAILTENRACFKSILGICGPAFETDLSLDTWMKGMEYVVKDPKDITWNWKIGNNNKWTSDYQLPRFWSRVQTRGI